MSAQHLRHLAPYHHLRLALGIFHLTTLRPSNYFAFVQFIALSVQFIYMCGHYFLGFLSCRHQTAGKRQRQASWRTQEVTYLYCLVSFIWYKVHSWAACPFYVLGFCSSDPICSLIWNGYLETHFEDCINKLLFSALLRNHRLCSLLTEQHINKPLFSALLRNHHLCSLLTEHQPFPAVV